MIEETLTRRTSEFIDKDSLCQLLDKVDARSGFLCHPAATPQRACEMMRAQGILAEDNLFSQDIIRTRFPNEFGKEVKE